MADRKNKKEHSLAAKTLQSIVLGCIVYVILTLIVALSFYAISQMRQNILNADSIARQARMTATYGADVIGFSEKVMNKYNSLTEEEKQMNGTEAYRNFFSDIKTDDGQNYENLLRMFNDITAVNNVYDVCVGMFDTVNNRLVYVVDADSDDRDRFFPGEWEETAPESIVSFFSPDDRYVLYTVEWTRTYGFLCTVGVPILDEDGEINSFVLVDISPKNILNGMAGFTLRIILTMIIAAALLALYQVNHIKKDLVDPINKLAAASKEYANRQPDGLSEKSYFETLDIHTGDELEKLSDNMVQMEKEIAEYEDNLKKITAEKQRIVTELALAQKIQFSMLPQEFPPFPDRKEFDIYALMEPAREVGGDFYDFFLIDDDHLCILIADVSGKGVPAALFMMVSKIIIQSCAMLGKSAAGILELTNKAICSNNTTEMFVTVWLGILEISTGNLTCANAGHEHPALLSGSGVFELQKEKHDFVVGGMDEMKYHERTIHLEPGDKIFVYTDGVPEAEDSEDNMYGTERMLDALNINPKAPAKELLGTVREDVRAFVKDAEQFDDLTMLCLEYYGG